MAMEVDGGDDATGARIATLRAEWSDICKCACWPKDVAMQLEQLELESVAWLDVDADLIRLNYSDRGGGGRLGVEWIRMVARLRRLHAACDGIRQQQLQQLEHQSHQHQHSMPEQPQSSPFSSSASSYVPPATEPTSSQSILATHNSSNVVSMDPVQQPQGFDLFPIAVPSQPHPFDLHPNDAFLYVEAKTLDGRSISVQEIHVEILASVRAWKRYSQTTVESISLISCTILGTFLVLEHCDTDWIMHPAGFAYKTSIPLHTNLLMRNTHLDQDTSGVILEFLGPNFMKETLNRKQTLTIFEDSCPIPVQVPFDQPGLGCTTLLSAVQQRVAGMLCRAFCISVLDECTGAIKRLRAADLEIELQVRTQQLRYNGYKEQKVRSVWIENEESPFSYSKDLSVSSWPVDSCAPAGWPFAFLVDVRVPGLKDVRKPRYNASSSNQVQPSPWRSIRHLFGRTPKVELDVHVRSLLNSNLNREWNLEQHRIITWCVDDARTNKLMIGIVRDLSQD